MVMSKKKKYWMFKAPIQLKNELDRIRLERIKKGKDLEFRSYRRLGIAIVRHPQLWEDLGKAKFLEEEDEE